MVTKDYPFPFPFLQDLLPGAKALRMMDNVIKQLDLLPQDLEDFYGRQIIALLEKKCLTKSV